MSCLNGVYKKSVLSASVASKRQNELHTMMYVLYIIQTESIICVFYTIFKQKAV